MTVTVSKSKVNIRDELNALRLNSIPTFKGLRIDSQSVTPPVSMRVNGEEYFKISQTGEIGMGKYANYNPSVVLQINGMQMNSRVYSSDVSPFYHATIKSRGAFGAMTSVNNNDGIFAYQAYAYDGSMERAAAVIAAHVDGVPANSTIPGRLTFYTTPAGTSQLPVERMRIDSNGNVLIGTTSVLESYGRTSLSIRGGSAGGLLELSDTSGGHSIIYWNSSANTLTIDARNPNAGIGYEAKGTGVHSFVNNGSECMRISTGGVGVGVIPTTQNGGNMLQVGGITNITGSSNASYWLSNLVYNSGWKYISADYGLMYQQSGGAHIWYTAPTGTAGAAASIAEKMRIDSAGNTQLLGNVYLNGANSNFSTQTAAAAGSNYALSYLYSRHPATASGRYWQVGMDGNASYIIYNNSSVGLYIAYGGTSWTAPSDERTKDIIEPITKAAEKVSSLRAVIGKYKSDEEGKRRSFIIAQDVQKVLPEAVTVQDDEQGTLGVAYSDLIPLLVAAIKEQQITIQSLTSRIEMLENK